jgi:hypothetical protein
MKTETRNALLGRIADQRLNLQTLETRNRDSLDFPTLAVWQIKAALEAAFEAGREVGQAEGATKEARVVQVIFGKRKEWFIPFANLEAFMAERGHAATVLCYLPEFEGVGAPTVDGEFAVYELPAIAREGKAE